MKSGLVAVSLFLAVAAAFAQTPVPGALKARARLQAVRQRRAAKALNLSEAQKAQVKTIREQGRLTAQPLAEKLQQNRQALHAAVKAGDAAQIQSLSKTQGELQGQITAVRSQSRAQMYAGLTNEQRKITEERQSRMRERVERFRANRPKAN